MTLRQVVNILTATRSSKCQEITAASESDLASYGLLKDGIKGSVENRRCQIMEINKSISSKPFLLVDLTFISSVVGTFVAKLICFCAGTVQLPATGTISYLKTIHAASAMISSATKCRHGSLKVETSSLYQR